MYPANSVDVHVLLRTVANVKLKPDAIEAIVIRVMARYNPPMQTNDEYESIIRVIAHSLAKARDNGADWVGQCQQAVSAVLTARPDMGESEAAKLVERVMVG